jgi:acyl-CoA thioesterase-1
MNERMLRPAVAVLSAVIAVSCLAATATSQERTASAPARSPNPAMVPIQDDPDLPRVLLIGDSISIGYTLPTRAALAGRANVHRPPANCGPSSRGIEQIDRWLGNGKWDVIHFNFGLHDLKLIDGKHQVPLAQYEKNLEALVLRLKRTGAVLVWCSTTPVPAGCEKPPRRNEDAIAYNAIAKRIMEKHGVAIDDLYAFALPQLEKIQRPANVHFTPEGSKVLARQVARSIAAALKQRAPQ